MKLEYKCTTIKIFLKLNQLQHKYEWHILQTLEFLNFGKLLK